jgi:uncharacterized YccA/Bax inhibitor family protein
MESSNPVFKKKTVSKLSDSLVAEETMTVGGSLSKTAFLLALVIGSGVFSWQLTSSDPARATALSFGSSIAALLVALVIIFKKPNPILVSLYALLQGIVLGSVSFLFNDAYQGIVMQAVMLTLGVTFGMLTLYTTGLVKVTQKFRSVVLIATVGVLFYYLFSFIIGLFNPAFIETMNSGSLGIVFAGIIVLIAALNLLLDFDFIDKGAEQELPKQFEWYAGFGLMVTLIWLYISILRLLVQSRK